ncbi:MarR family winged helix-turn-helix transcriptional regulator [Actinomycetospora termitidis]|uniref:MarR family transcriptional regulator n=1 Tax=Actinomycetospora termitidis TaxID=3053470 RepID=A0ABT7MCD6_9PSEU|nr:MarR family transcriptional regulator [Actinomycetospora sp. Odt1-22]MDL5158333.1 MarR family transcriptional regulator [Actinomycetospora sp. Odt1-22]
MGGGEQDVGRRQREQVAQALSAYAAGQSELGRVFARRSGLHPTDAAALVEILRAEQRGHPLTPARLAPLVGLTSGATSILLNRLEEAGRVTRVRGHADRRTVTLHSSAAVTESSEAFFGPLRARLDEILSRYSATELDVVGTLVHELSAAVDAYTGPPST